MRRCPTLIPDTGTAPLHLSCFIGRCITSTPLRSAPACIAAALPPSYHAPAQSALPPRCRNPDSLSCYYSFCSFCFFHNYMSSILYINPVLCPHSSNNQVISSISIPNSIVTTHQAVCRNLPSLLDRTCSFPLRLSSLSWALPHLLEPSSAPFAVALSSATSGLTPISPLEESVI